MVRINRLRLRHVLVRKLVQLEADLVAISAGEQQLLVLVRSFRAAGV